MGSRFKGRTVSAFNEQENIDKIKKATDNFINELLEIGLSKKGYDYMITYLQIEIKRIDNEDILVIDESIKELKRLVESLRGLKG